MPKLTAYEKDPSVFETEKSIAAAYKDDFKALKRQYTKLRDVAEKRRKRALQGKYASYSFVSNRSQPFLKLKEIQSEKELISAVKKISDYIQNPRSTAEGLAEQIHFNIKNIEKHYGEMDEETYLLFDKYMREWHVRKDLKRYDSDRVAQFIEDAVNKKANFKALFKNFRQYLSRYEKQAQKETVKTVVGIINRGFNS